MSEKFRKAGGLILYTIILAFYVVWGIKFIVFVWNRL